MGTKLTSLEIQSGRDPDEPWEDWHARMYDAMVTSKNPLVDPVTGKSVPSHIPTKRHPNRRERRIIKHWRGDS